MSGLCHRVFVYGTLKRGQPNHHWLTNDANGKSELVCEGVTSDCFPLLTATRFNIPFLINSPENGHRVAGETYKVDDDMLKHLDLLEDYPRFYDRIAIDVTAADG